VCKHFYEPEPFVKPLEKIEMKKTLVALAAISAITGAMADAKISGVLDQAYISSGATSAAGVKSTTKSVGSANNGTSEFTLSGSEDLTGGIKANFALNVQADINAPQAATPLVNGMAMRRSFVGLSSNEMGNIRLGNQWTPSFFVMLAADPTGAVAGTGYVMAPTAFGAAANSITYDLPTFVSGLAVQLQKGQGDQAANQPAGQNQGYSLTYTTGAFMAAYGSQKLTAGGALATADLTTSIGANVLAALTTTSKISSTSYTLTYDLGLAKLHYGSSKDKVTGTTAAINASIYGVTVPLGKDTKLGLMQTSATDTTTAGATFKEKGSRYAIFHNLSARTQLFAFTTKSTQTGTTAAANTNAIGIQHAF